MSARIPIAVGAVLALAGAGVWLGGILGPRGPAGPSVVLVTLDTIRADHLSAYGYSRDTTPELGRLAARGVLFRRAIAQAPNTPVSHASILSGLAPYSHGLRRMHGGSAADLTPRTRFLAQAFRDEGWRTAGFVGAFPAGSWFGLDRGFERFDESFGDGEDPVGEGGAINTGLAQRSSDRTVDLALAWIESLEPGERFFVWVHVFDPHDPYLLPPAQDRFRYSNGIPAPGDAAGKDRLLIDLYDAEIRYADRQLGRLFDAVGSDAIVAVVGDHGEGLGDHGWWTHGNMYQEQLRVPMILAGPGCGQGVSIDSTVRTIDVAPTLYELARLRSRPSPLDGTSLVPGLEGGDLPPLPPAYAEVRGEATYHARWLGHRDPEVRGEAFALIEDGWKVILRTQPERIELYDLDADPLETLDRSGAEPDRLRRLLGRLADLGASDDAAGGEGPLPPDVVRKLRSLGYQGR